MKLLSISTDRKIFEEGSAVRARQIEYANKYDEVHIIVFAGREFSEQSISPNCFVYPTRSWSKLMYPFDATRLGRFIVSGRNITHVTCQDPSLTAMAGVALKKQFGLPLEIQVHTDIGSPNFPYSVGNKIRKALALSYLPKADSIRVVSGRIKDYLVGSLGISNEKIEVRPIAVDPNIIRNTPVTIDLHKRYSQFEKIILMASRLEKEKNISLALEAFATVLKSKPKVGLIIVGEGSERERLKELTASLGIDTNVIFQPWANLDLLYSYYKTADLFLVTSLFEGYGMSLVEAQAAGLKTISTDVGVAKETGAMIVPWNEAEVANEIIKALAL